MSTNRKRSNLVHIKGKQVFKLSKDKHNGVFYIRGTNIVVPDNKIRRPENLGAKKKSNYDFSKPFQAQDLGSEWDDYAWSADDY